MEKQIIAGSGCGAQPRRGGCACGGGQAILATPTPAPAPADQAHPGPAAEAIKRRAYAHLMSGLHCAEVVALTVMEAYAGPADPRLVKAASGFGGGLVGSTEELCGAFTGGVLVLGLLLGRERPGQDLRDLACAVLDLKERFVARFGSLNCGALMDGFGEQGQQKGCARLTANSAVMVAQVLEDLAAARGQDLAALCSQPRQQAALGGCPFRAGL